jgi:glucose-1-phosphate adenylyltransferase
VGTIDSFYEAHEDLISPLPIFNLYNREWPIFTRATTSPPAKLVRGARNSIGVALDTLLSAGVVISGGIVEDSVLSNDVYVGTGARVLASVLMDEVSIGEGAVVQRAILDKNIKVPAFATIGLDPERDRAKGYKITESGITVLAKGQTVPEPDENEVAAAKAAAKRLPAAVRIATDASEDMQRSIDAVADNQLAAAHAASGRSNGVSGGRDAAVSSAAEEGPR